MKNYDIAIKEINPNAEFYIIGDGEECLNNITWLNGTTPIAKEIIIAKEAEINIRDAHVNARAKAYPSIEKQLDMQYWDKVNGTDTWEQAINAVKAQYPKA